MKPYPAYRDSGVEWIGEVPEHWEVTKIKYVAAKAVDYGLNIGSDKYVADGIRFLRTTDIDDYGHINEDGVYLDNNNVDEEYLLEMGDLLISRSGTVGRGYVHETSKTLFSFAGYLVRIRFQNSDISKFIFYLTKSYIFQNWLKSISVESTIGNVNGQKYANYIFAVPSTAEIKSIVTYLNSKLHKIDTLIEKKQKQIELLKEERTAIINQAVTKGLNPDVQMKDSGIEWLGEVPKHWEITKVKWLLKKIGSGITPKGGAEVYLEEGIPIIRSQNVHFEGLKLDDVAYISEETHRLMNRSAVEPSDVLINITGASIGRCTNVPEDLGEANVNQHVCILRPGFDVNSHYLSIFLSSDFGQLQVWSSQTGAAREGLNYEQLGNFVFSLPPVIEQNEIVKKVHSHTNLILNSINLIHNQITLLQEYRTALISNAVTGKIDVRDETIS
jgi:type I restriction enzyme S subunit